MPQFRKKPVVIEARQFDGSWESASDLIEWIKAGVATRFNPSWNSASRTLAVPTLEGVMQADANDWIIKGVKDEFYPCKPDIFEATYEAV